jgi:hypothetical protein
MALLLDSERVVAEVTRPMKKQIAKNPAAAGLALLH